MVFSCVVLAALMAAGEAAVRPANCPEPPIGGILGTSSAGDASSGLPNAQPPRQKTRVQPSYPSDLKKTPGLHAKVIMEGTIDIDGNVGDVHTLKCTAKRGSNTLGEEEKEQYCTAFQAAAAVAFRQWRYEPAVQNGKAACVYVTVVFSFN